MSDRQDFLEATRILVDATLKRGDNNKRAIKKLLEWEDYEALEVVKKVFEKNGKKMELPL